MLLIVDSVQRYTELGAKPRVARMFTRQQVPTHHAGVAAPRTPDVNVRNNMLAFAFNPPNCANDQIAKQMASAILRAKSVLETGGGGNKAEKTQIAIVTITIIAASINMKYGPV